VLLRWLSEAGYGFDCASAREIEIVLDSANETRDIVFANPCKKREDIQYAKEVGIQTTVVDSVEEVHKLAECGWKGDSLIRIMVQDSGSKMPFSAKFGCPLSQVQPIHAVAQRLGQKISGISFHVGSGCQDPDQYYKAIWDANSVAKQLIPGQYTIDIGGGFVNSGFEAAARQIQRVRGYIPSNTRVIAEPGRFFASTCQDLFVKVIGKKPTHDRKGFRYTLDESLYGQFSCIPFDQATPKWIRVSESDMKRKKYSAILYGRTCDSVDMIAKAEEAEELMEGDWLWFPNMGAYTTVTSTEFNGFPRPPLITVEKEALPNLNEFEKDDWPSNLSYVRHVSVQ
jgi:ornithine decarboxylase